jgi:hypothetical protein
VRSYFPTISIVAADKENVENGMIGYITMGIDTTAVETWDQLTKKMCLYIKIVGIKKVQIDANEVKIMTSYHF